jgi:small subunit ribosomal protein S1
MVKNPQVVYDKAEEMAAKYRERMLQQSQPEQVAVESLPVVEEEIPSASEDEQDD